MKSFNSYIAVTVFILLFITTSKAKQPPADLGYEPPAGWEFVMKLDSVDRLDIYSYNDTCYLRVGFSTISSKQKETLSVLTTNSGDTWVDIPSLPLPLMFIKNTLNCQGVRFEDPYYFYKKSYDFYKTNEKSIITGSGLPFDSLYRSPIDTNILIATFKSIWMVDDFYKKDQIKKGNMKVFISNDAGKTWEELSNLYRYPEVYTLYEFNFDWAEKGHWFVSAIDGRDLGFKNYSLNFETFDDGKTFSKIKFKPTSLTDINNQYIYSMQFGIDGKKTLRTFTNSYSDTVKVSEYTDTIASAKSLDWLYLMDPTKPKTNKDSGYYRSLFTWFYEFDYSNYSNIFLPTIENFIDSTYENKIHIYNSFFQSRDHGKSWQVINQFNELPSLNKLFLDQGTKILWLFVHDEKYKPGQFTYHLKGSLWKLKLDWQGTSVEHIENKDKIK